MSVDLVQRISIPVSDQDAAKEFYTSKLGFEATMDMPVPMGENARWIEVAPTNGPSLILTTWLPMEAGSVSGIMLQTKDVEKSAAALSKDGVKVEGPNETPWGKQATFSDPDGNEFVLVEPTE